MQQLLSTCSFVDRYRRSLYEESLVLDGGAKWCTKRCTIVFFQAVLIIFQTFSVTIVQKASMLFSILFLNK